MEGETRRQEDKSAERRDQVAHPLQDQGKIEGTHLAPYYAF